MKLCQTSSLPQCHMLLKRSIIYLSNFPCQVVISNHGVVSFGDQRTTQCPTNCQLYSEKSPMIAIFLVPNENVNKGGIFYRVTDDQNILKRANQGTNIISPSSTFKDLKNHCVHEFQFPSFLIVFYFRFVKKVNQNSEFNTLSYFYS